MIVALISLLALIYGSYTDIKTREIPDTLSFGMIFLGISISIGASILFWSYKPILSSVIGLAIGALIGLLSYYTGQWGGGDAKVLMGLGSLIGVDVFSLSNGVPEFGLFLINLILFGAIYGVLWLLGLAIKNWSLFRPEFRMLRTQRKIIRLRIIILSAVILFTVIVFAFNPEFLMLATIYLLMFFALVFLYLFLIVKAVENTCLKKEILVKNLTEGDWVLEKVKLRNADKFIYTKTGITEKGINMLLKSKKKKILVKEGIPFIPSFLIAYIITLVLGNWIPLF